MAALLLHTVISTIRLQKSIGAAVRIRDNVWESSAVESPFVLGMIRPRIYVSRGMSEEKLTYVIAHDEVFRKWGERIAAVGVNEERNCVDVYVYGFDEGNIERFYKALGHLSYVENLSLWKVLRKLSDKDITIIKLHVLFDNFFKELGRVLRMTETAARQRYNRAIRVLRDIVEE
ncbi:MAG: hypothetical protein IJA85_11575 [Clostridia bacterium]|nr:hypothetical protein [Clostridia bacterium]